MSNESQAEHINCALELIANAADSKHQSITLPIEVTLAAEEWVILYTIAKEEGKTPGEMLSKALKQRDAVNELANQRTVPTITAGKEAA